MGGDLPVFQRFVKFLQGLWARLSWTGGAHYLSGGPGLPPPLTPEEEKALLARMADGDPAARDALITHNLRLVVYLAKKYEGSGVPSEDMVSIGTIGLIKAVNTFTPERSIKLATYASRCIGNEILMYLRKSSNRRQEASIDEPLNIDGDGNELLLSDVLSSEENQVGQRLEQDAERASLRRSVEQLSPRERAGDKAARQSMIEGNLRLVLSVVQRFSQRGENMDDLFQVGCIGLIKAIDNFDPAQQVRFSTYGVPMIIGEIRRFLRDNNALRVSRSLRDTAYRAMQSREELEKQLGREPTVEEIAQKTGLPRQEVSAAMESVVEPLSLEEPVYADGGDAVYVIDQVRDPDGEDSWISGLQFRQTVAGLTPREKRIMELRYLKGKTQMEVAQEIGISQAQVSRLEKAALEQFHQQT